MVLRAAVMAFEAVFFAVVREGNVAGRALCDVAAFAADDALRESPAVDEQDRLLSLFEAFGKFLAQGCRKGRVVAAAHFPAHIRHDHFGKGPRVDAFGEFQKSVFPFSGFQISFYRRRGAAENQFTAVVFCAQPRDLVRTVARAGFADIALVVFLVHDDDAHVFHGREHGAARADGNLRLARAQPPPFVEFFARGKPAVQNGRALAEAGAQLLEHLRRQGNLGD